MNNEKEFVLEKTAKEYYASGREEFEKKRYNSAVVLYFKALIALTDLFILEQTGNTPSSHINRFKILKEKFPKIYSLIDKDFPYYQDSYVQIMSSELAEVIKEDVQTMAEKLNLEL